MNDAQKEYCSKITYKVIPRDSLIQLTGKVLDVEIIIYHIDEEESPILTGRLDWQDGLHIWQSECIDPGSWSTVANQMLLAMKAAKELIDPVTYCAGEPG